MKWLFWRARARHCSERSEVIEREIEKLCRRYAAPVQATVMRLERSPVEAYAPMLRLLNDEDVSFLIRRGLFEHASELRREHRSIFRQYLRIMFRDARSTCARWADHIANRGDWGQLVRHRATEWAIYKHIGHLYWLSVRHSLGIPITKARVSNHVRAIQALMEVALQG